MSSLGLLMMLADAAGGAAAKDPPWYYKYVLGGNLPLLLFALAMFFVLRSRKPNSDKNRELGLKDLKRGDRVQTIGGILGTVVDARDTEVVLKVDESSNTKIKFSRSAIHRVIEDDKAAAAASK